MSSSDQENSKEAEAKDVSIKIPSKHVDVQVKPLKGPLTHDMRQNIVDALAKIDALYDDPHDRQLSDDDAQTVRDWKIMQLWVSSLSPSLQ
jgi:hypothetical protein